MRSNLRFPDNQIPVKTINGKTPDANGDIVPIGRSIITANSASLNVNDFDVILYNLVGNETLSFGNTGNNIINFKLFLRMPSTLVSFNWPTNIEWESQPDMTYADSLYMFTFEYNPILGKWLGNQFWPTKDMSSNSNSSSVS